MRVQAGIASVSPNSQSKRWPPMVELPRPCMTAWMVLALWRYGRLRQPASQPCTLSVMVGMLGAASAIVRPKNSSALAAARRRCVSAPGKRNGDAAPVGVLGADQAPGGLHRRLRFDIAPVRRHEGRAHLFGHDRALAP